MKFNTKKKNVEQKRHRTEEINNSDSLDKLRHQVQMCDAFSKLHRESFSLCNFLSAHSQQDRSKNDSKEDRWISFGYQRRLPANDLVFIHNTGFPGNSSFGTFPRKKDRALVCT